jgi:choline-glycine betaine transporter
MSFTPDVLVESQFAPAAQTAIFNSPANTTCTVTSATVTNVDSASHTLSVWLVPSQQAPASSNELISGQVIPAGAAVHLVLEGKNLLQGDSIWAEASAGNVLVLQISGFEIS